LRCPFYWGKINLTPSVPRPQAIRNIPALPGNEGFSTREEAQTVAEFVVKKIRKNEMPPTVTI
jgi:hypothetical protein